MKLRRYWTFLLWTCWAWSVMTLTHELGHVVAGLVGGATLVALELRPFHLPHSSFAGDQHPLVTLWAGFVVGSVVPLLIAVVRPRPACWFVAWFCVLANGVYLLLGWISGDGELDAARLIAAGAHSIEIIAFAGLMIVIGYPLFRRSCIEILSGEIPPMTGRGLATSAAILGLLLVIQFAIAQRVDGR